MSYGGYLVATEVLEKLQQSGKMASVIICLSALKEAGDGQANLAEGNFNSALTKCKNAAKQFEQIPEAKYLLGICKVDISAAYGGLKDYNNEIKYAKEAVALVSGKAELSYSEGTANMNIGTALYRLGDLTGALKHYTEALRILEKAHGGSRFISGVKTNIEIIREELSGNSHIKF